MSEPKFGPCEPQPRDINILANALRKEGIVTDNRMLSGGGPITSDHREINPTTGQQKGYIVLTPEERAKGFVRPVRRIYLHKTCGTTTTMSEDIAETYARQPDFYDGTFCVSCRKHLPLAEFVWDGTDETVGS